MNLDIYNLPVEVEIGEKVYQVEFDNKAYVELESKTGKGVFNLYNTFIIENNLSLAESAEILCAGLIKHHKKEEIGVVREFIGENPWVFTRCLDVIQYAFMMPLLPPELMKELEPSGKKTIKKKTVKKK